MPETATLVTIRPDHGELMHVHENDMFNYGPFEILNEDDPVLDTAPFAAKAKRMWEAHHAGGNQEQAIIRERIIAIRLGDEWATAAYPDVTQWACYKR